MVAVGAGWPTLLAADAPLPRERPAFETAGERTSHVRRLPPVAAEELAERTREALEHVFAKRYTDALAIQRDLNDPLAVALVEYFYIREAGSQVPHQRIASFLEAYPEWLSRNQLRRLHEVALLVQRADNGTVLEALSKEPPLTNPGIIIFATALTEAGESARAAEMIGELWRTGNLTDGEERLIRQRFPDLITRDEIRFRMARQAYAGSRGAALRLARELGDDYVKLVEARLAVHQNAGNAKQLLDGVPESLHRDPLYQFSRAQHLRRAGDNAAAAEIILEATQDAGLLADTDAWATERRIVGRGLVEAGEAETAYRVVSGHSAQGVVARLETNWQAGWTALRFLEDPARARTYFARMTEDATRPISISRAEYWLGRTAEAAGDNDRATRHFAAAASHPTAYYGQLALDRVARADMTAARKPIHADAARRIVQERDEVRALRLLAQAGYSRLVPGLLMALAEASDDHVTLVGLAEIAHIMGHPTATVQIGRRGTYVGAPTEKYAFTQLGIPDFQSVGPAAEPALVYAIARQESLFNAAAVSPAGALGLMQLMPATARETAQRYGLSYSQGRLTAEPTYNAALGAAHLGELIAEFGDAYALVFAAYNAGRSRVYQWLKRFGDPRLGQVDPVDWVEMIPFNETRNYVQRVMEGLQVYRAGLEGQGPLLIARDLRLRDEHRGDLYLAIEDADPFSALSDADVASTEDKERGLGFAPTNRGLSFGSTGAATSTFGFGGGGNSFGFGGN